MPTWKSYWSNTWVVFNQLDVEIEYEKSSGSITSSNFRFDRINQSIMIAEGKLNTQGLRQNSSDIGMPYNGNLVFQLPQLLLFWLPNKDPNVWVEVLPYPSLFHETGLELISVEYPFSRWHKPVNPAFKLTLLSLNFAEVNQFIWLDLKVIRIIPMILDSGKIQNLQSGLSIKQTSKQNSRGG